MCEPSTIIAAIATTAAVGTSYVSMENNKKAARTQEAMQRLKQQKDQIQALREAQIQRALLVQRSAGAGALDTSGFSGGMSSIGSQLAGSQMYANQMGSMGTIASRFQTKAQTFGALSQISGQVAGFAMSAEGSKFINSIGSK
jgi:hypothetical protein